MNVQKLYKTNLIHGQLQITTKDSQITNLIENNTEEEEDNVEDLVDNHLNK